MSTIYWNQWPRFELMSMQGVELDIYRYDDRYDCQNDRIPEGEPDGCCTGCMQCLGLSLREFK
jgi:hypothetical protein